MCVCVHVCVCVCMCVCVHVCMCVCVHVCVCVCLLGVDKQNFEGDNVTQNGQRYYYGVNHQNSCMTYTEPTFALQVRAVPSGSCNYCV